MSHESVVKAAEHIGFPPGLVSYIRCLYTVKVTQLRVGHALGSLIFPARGVRQGDPLLPLLFCAVMDWVLVHHFSCRKGCALIVSRSLMMWHWCRPVRLP